jgi:toxin ParE1/3/4
VSLGVAYLPEAERDIDAIADYIAADSIKAALRFYAAVRSDSSRLAEMPGLGARWFDSPAELVDLRGWLVTGFRNYILFYRVKADQIDVIRVVHGARDLAQQLGRSPR